MTTPIEGAVAPGFEAVRAGFIENFNEGLELGAGFAVIRDGAVIVDLVGGWADVGRTRAFTQHSLAPIFSVTKALTAFVVMRLVEQGVVALETPIVEYWPEFGVGGKETATLAQVLAHQAAVPGVSRPMTADALIAHAPFAAAIAAEPAYWPPGEAAAYHSVTAGHILQEVVRRRTGATVGRLFSEIFAAPLGLDLHIGMPRGRASDAAEAVDAPGIVEERLAKAAAFPRARDSLLNPMLSAALVNRDDWRAAEIPGAGGVGAALGVAQAMRRALAPEGGGLSDESRALLTTPRVDGLDCLVDAPLRLSLGLMLNDADKIFGPSAEAAGHTGRGGAFAFYDPTRALAVAYAPTRLLPTDAAMARRRRRLLDPLFAAL